MLDQRTISVPTAKGNQTFIGIPNTCPFCHKSIHPEIIYGIPRGQFCADVLMHCPDRDCERGFLGYYNLQPGGFLMFSGETSNGNLLIKVFSDEIKSVSQEFEAIYNQSLQAEQIGLDQICGVGYRKALEFLIKDYCILKSVKDKELIEKLLLGKVIDQYVNDDRIKKVAKRAVWIGNDETHYVRRWENKSIDDLKKLIDLTIHWIEAEILTESISKEMN